MKRKLDEQHLPPDIEDLTRQINESQFMRGSKFAKKDTRTAEQKLLYMPCSPTIH